MNINFDDTIAAVSTPLGEGGIGIVRLSGPGAITIADKMFVSKDGKRVPEYETYTVHYGHVLDSNQKPEYRNQKKDKRGYVDEVLLTVMRAPKSYTKEDVVEINCHGGPAALKCVLELALKYGARVAEAGEFTKRAFLNGRIDLAQAEAVADMISAKTEASLRSAMGQLEGGLSERVLYLIEKLSGALSHMEAAVDFPDEEIEIMGSADAAGIMDEVRKGIEKLLETSSAGIILREGFLVIICGKPNVGKSSLMNLLLKRDRVIVTPIPGTTRDAVEEVISLKGFPVRIVDTAGISETRDTLDREGVLRSRRYLDMADMVIFVLDGSSPLEREDFLIMEILKDKKVIAVVNKTDLPKRLDEAGIKGAMKTEDVVRVSVLKKKNIESLEGAIVKCLESGRVFQGEGAFVTNARQKASLEQALKYVVQAARSVKEGLSSEFISQDMKEVLYHLGLIVGKSVSEDMLDRIFCEFCVGK